MNFVNGFADIIKHLFNFLVKFAQKFLIFWLFNCQNSSENHGQIIQY